MIESLRTMQMAFFRLATHSGFLGVGDKVQKVFVQGSVQGKILWNHLWEHRFSVPDPGVFPPPGDPFSAPMTENRIYNWTAPERDSLVIIDIWSNNVEQTYRVPWNHLQSSGIVAKFNAWVPVTQIYSS